MSATETKVRNVVEPIITNLNYKLYDVIYEKRRFRQLFKNCY